MRLHGSDVARGARAVEPEKEVIMNSIEQTFIDTVQSPIGKMILTVLAIGVGILLLTYIGPLVAIIVIGVVIYLALHYFGNRI